MAGKLKPFDKLLKAETPIDILSDLHENFDSVNKGLSDLCEIALT